MSPVEVPGQSTDPSSPPDVDTCFTVMPVIKVERPQHMHTQTITQTDKREMAEKQTHTVEIQPTIEEFKVGCVIVDFLYFLFLISLYAPHFLHIRIILHPFSF